MTKSNIIGFPARDTKQSTGYRWVDKDPLMDFVLFVLDDCGMTLVQISNKTGLAVSTMRNWQTGKTKKPQRESMDILFRLLGYEFRVYNTRTNRKAWPHA